jgi:hypothetical protein
VDGVDSSEAYMALLGEAKMAELRIKVKAETAVADYGY